MSRGVSLREQGLRDNGAGRPAGGVMPVAADLTSGLLDGERVVLSSNLHPAARPVYVETAPRTDSRVPGIEPGSESRVSADTGATVETAIIPAVSPFSYHSPASARSGNIEPEKNRFMDMDTVKKIGRGIWKFAKMAFGIDEIEKAFKCFREGKLGAGLLHLAIGGTFLAISVGSLGSAGVMIGLGRGALRVGFRALAGRSLVAAEAELGKTLTKEVVVEAYAGMAKESMGLIQKLATRKLTPKSVQGICAQTVEKGTDGLLRSHGAVKILEDATLDALQWLEKTSIKEVAAELGVSNTRARVMKLMLRSDLAEGAIKKHMVDEMTTGMVSNLIEKGAKDAYMGVMRKELAELGVERGLNEMAVEGLVKGAEKGFNIGIRKGVLEVVKEAVERAFRRFKGEYYVCSALASDLEPTKAKRIETARVLEPIVVGQFSVVESKRLEDRKQWWGRFDRRRSYRSEGEGDKEEVIDDVKNDAA